MKKLFLFILVLVVASSFLFFQNVATSEVVPEIQNLPIESEVILEVNSFTIANFNAQIFGDSKIEKLGVDWYVDLVEGYDIFFLQEIRDKDGSSFDSLCDALVEYDCVVSSRAGRSNSKEQYGVLFREGITVKNFEDFNPDNEDRWERPPIAVTFDVNGYEFTAWNIHTKPTDVENEINALKSVVSDEGNVVVLGDLNLDGSYDDGSEGDFDEWNYLIQDDEDTTVADSSNAYDRIILNDDMNEEYSSDGIIDTFVKNETDHYLVWVEVRV